MSNINTNEVVHKNYYKNYACNNKVLVIDFTNTHTLGTNEVSMSAIYKAYKTKVGTTGTWNKCLMGCLRSDLKGIKYVVNELTPGTLSQVKEWLFWTHVQVIYAKEKFTMKAVFNKRKYEAFMSIGDYKPVKFSQIVWDNLKDVTSELEMAIKYMPKALYNSYDVKCQLFNVLTPDEFKHSERARQIELVNTWARAFDMEPIQELITPNNWTIDLRYVEAKSGAWTAEMWDKYKTKNGYKYWLDKFNQASNAEVLLKYTTILYYLTDVDQYLSDSYEICSSCHKPILKSLLICDKCESEQHYKLSPEELQAFQLDGETLPKGFRLDLALEFYNNNNN